MWLKRGRGNAEPKVLLSTCALLRAEFLFVVFWFKIKPMHI